ncbi:MAG: DNA polymerase-4 [Paracoccaceae bacterium]|jgi:DNA polymerase-4
MKSLCRRCQTEFTELGLSACPACGAADVVTHAEMSTLSIAHLDCDSFYASVEKRDNPELIDKPVLVGGQKRGVVMAACYIAREYGVHSAMPMFKALRACPDAVVVKPDMAKYGRIGRDIREMMRTVTPLVEPISIDEAFLDMTGTERLHGGSPARTLARLVCEIENRHGITVSIGLSHNKFLAKLSSGLNKPQGFTVIGRTETVPFLSRQPVSRIWGVGKVFQRTLERDGITMIGELQQLSEEDLTRRYGEIGSRMARLAHGRDTRKVVPGSGRKSLSSETTFADDISDPGRLSRILWRQAEKVSAGIKKEDIGGRTVTLKLKTARFAIRTRSRTLPHPTQLADAIYAAANPLLEKEADGTAFRLLGIGLSEFAPQEDCDPIDLADPDLQRRKKVEGAVDDLRARFGTDAIGKGRMLET